MRVAGVRIGDRERAERGAGRCALKDDVRGRGNRGRRLRGDGGDDEILFERKAAVVRAADAHRVIRARRTGGGGERERAARERERAAGIRHQRVGECVAGIAVVRRERADCRARRRERGDLDVREQDVSRRNVCERDDRRRDVARVAARERRVGRAARALRRHRADGDNSRVRRPASARQPDLIAAVGERNHRAAVARAIRVRVRVAHREFLAGIEREHDRRRGERERLRPRRRVVHARDAREADAEHGKIVVAEHAHDERRHAPAHGADVHVEIGERDLLRHAAVVRVSIRLVHDHDRAPAVEDRRVRVVVAELRRARTVAIRLHDERERRVAAPRIVAIDHARLVRLHREQLIRDVAIEIPRDERAPARVRRARGKHIEPRARAPAVKHIARARAQQESLGQPAVQISRADRDLRRASSAGVDAARRARRTLDVENPQARLLHPKLIPARARNIPPDRRAEIRRRENRRPETAAARPVRREDQRLIARVDDDKLIHRVRRIEIPARHRPDRAPAEARERIRRAIEREERAAIAEIVAHHHRVARRVRQKLSRRQIIDRRTERPRRRLRREVVVIKPAVRDEHDLLLPVARHVRADDLRRIRRRDQRRARIDPIGKHQIASIDPRHAPRADRDVVSRRLINRGRVRRDGEHHCKKERGELQHT